MSIVKHNWPELLDSKKIDGMTLCDGDGNPISLDDKALSHLLSNNINTGIDLEGSLYWPGLGVTNSGDSAWAVIKANQMVNKVVVVQWNFIRNRERTIKCFKDILSRNNRAIPPVFDIHYDYIPVLDQFLVIDRISGAAYDYSGNRCVLLKKMDRTAS